MAVRGVGAVECCRPIVWLCHLIGLSQLAIALPTGCISPIRFKGFLSVTWLVKTKDGWEHKQDIFPDECGQRLYPNDASVTRHYVKKDVEKQQSSHPDPGSKIRACIAPASASGCRSMVVGDGWLGEVRQVEKSVNNMGNDEEAKMKSASPNYHTIWIVPSVSARLKIGQLFGSTGARSSPLLYNMLYNNPPADHPDSVMMQRHPVAMIMVELGGGRGRDAIIHFPPCRWSAQKHEDDDAATSATAAQNIHAAVCDAVLCCAV